ncbi:MAG TPA: hypothetical protein VLT87_23775 [Thermoanaerobaculia bacterium]|nr:hypothetical protein [Thermoanaerobaculia bacterium]
MPLQIFVEDKLVDAYEILARKALGLPGSSSNRREVRAARIDPDELTSRNSLLDLTQRSFAAGYDTILFILDQEGPRSPERAEKLAGFKRAFHELCDHLGSLKDGDPLRRVKVVRIICQRCLEGWLATDPVAIVEALSGAQGSDYKPAPRNTENLFPEQASALIAQIGRELGNRLGKDHLKRLDPRSIKTRGKDIAQHVDPQRARKCNASLAYFFEMVDGHRSGCDHPCPE